MALIASLFQVHLGTDRDKSPPVSCAHGSVGSRSWDRHERAEVGACGARAFFELSRLHRKADNRTMVSTATLITMVAVRRHDKPQAIHPLV